MPKIKITENDLTGSGLSLKSSHTVYIPGLGLSAAIAPELVESSFSKTLTEAKGYDVNCLSYKLAKYICDTLGLPILYEALVSGSNDASTASWGELKDKSKYSIRFLTTGQFGGPCEDELLCAATRGDCIALEDHIEDIFSISSYDSYSLLTADTAPSDWPTTETASTKYFSVTAWASLESVTDEDFKANFAFIRSGEEGAYLYTPLTQKPYLWDTNYTNYYKVTTATGVTASNTYTEDTFYLKSAAFDGDEVQKVRDAFEVVLQGYTTPSTIISEENKKNSYAAAFTPWFKTTLSDLGGTKIAPESIPASFAYIFDYARSINSNPEWFAVAGSSRGQTPEISSLSYQYSDSQCEILQGRDKDSDVDLDAVTDNKNFAINPIANIRPFGNIVWGNRTLLVPEADQLSEDGGYNLKSTAFLNVRNLVCTIKKALYEAARKYTFDQNSDILWINFSSKITPLLENMKVGNGILGYTFIRDKTDRKARLKASLVIVPIEGVEDFEFEIELKDSLNITNI